jgi:hypothetical protein
MEGQYAIRCDADLKLCTVGQDVWEDTPLGELRTNVVHVEVVDHDRGNR